MDQLNNEYVLSPSITYLLNNSSSNSLKFSICYYNMRIIVRRMTVLETSVASLPYRPDVIAVTETRIYDNEAKIFNLEGYKSFFSSRPYHPGKGRGGGTALFVKDRLDMQCNLLSSVHFEDANILVIKLINSNIHINLQTRTNNDGFIYC